MLQLSSRAAATLVYRLCTPQLTPIAKAAFKHEKALQRAFLKAIKDAQDAMPMAELESVLSLGHPGTGAPLHVLQPVFEMLLEQTERRTEHIPYMRVAAEKDPSIADALLNAVSGGAFAGEVCTVGNLSTENKQLASAAIKSVEHKGSVAVVTLENGEKALFKRASDALVQNEKVVRIAAEELRSLSALPSMVARTVEGEKGLLFEFVDGQTGASLSSKLRYGAGGDVADGAVLDFVLANGDRNANNWLVEKSGKLHFIDHDALFSSRVRSGLFDQMRELEDMISFGDIKAPTWFASPQSYAAKVDIEKLVARLRESGVGARDLEGVTRRLNALKKANAWAALVGDM